MSAVTNLSRVDPTVDPGGESAVTIRIRNAGSIVDRFDVDVVGPTAGWARVDPPSLSLFPGVEGTITVTFMPPRATTPRAGIYPFGIRVRPAADPTGSNVEEGRLTVTPFTSVAAEIVPQTSRGSRVARHQVVVDNRGNAPSEVVVVAVDPDRRLGLSVDPPRAVVPPERQVAFGIRVEVDDPFPFGQARQRPFQVSVEPGRQEPIALRATMNQRPMLPGWIPPVLGVGALVAIVAVGSFLAKAGPFSPNATPEPSQVAQVSAGPLLPSVEPSVGPPSDAAPSAAEPSDDGSGAASASPTPAPFKPKDFTLAVTGDKGELGADLSLKCEASDKTCRNSVKDDLLALVTGLKNPYTGAGITSTRSLAANNALPLVMSSAREFPWASESGQTGTTTSVVVDLGPLLASPAGFPYVLVTSPDGIPHRFVVDSGLAQQLFDKLYLLAQGMPSIAPATLDPGILIGDPISVASAWDPNRQFLLMLPLITPTP